MFGRDKQTVNTPQQQANTQANSGGSQIAPKIETVIGPNCHVSGVLQSDGGIRVEGIFEGTLHTTGNLIIAETARVIADVNAFNMVVSGSVKGNVTANRLEVTESGKVWGDLNVNSLLLAEGAYLRGQTNMTGDIEPPVVEPPRISAPKPVIAELESPNN